MRRIICVLAVIGAGLAAGAATATSAPQAQIRHQDLDGGFGRGYGIFHSYGWARGTAGYASGACYWHAELCEAQDD